MSAYYSQSSAYQPQSSSGGFGWFRGAVQADPELERAYRAQQEFFSSQQSLLGRYTPAQLAAFGLSPLSTPGGGTPFVQSVPPTAPPSTQPSMRPTPVPSTYPSPPQRPTPVTSTYPSPTPPSGQRSSGGQRSSRSSGARSGRGSGSCCFGGRGGSASDSPPRSPPPPRSPLGAPHEDEDRDAPAPDARGYYYYIHWGGRWI